MNWHPLTLTLLLLTAVGLVIYLFAAVRMFFLLPHWQAAGDDAAQLLREREMEVIDVQGRWAMLLLAVAMVLLVFGISNVWPALVPGAMCGTGVMEALGPDGWRALIFLAWRPSYALPLALYSKGGGAVSAIGSRPIPGPSVFAGRAVLGIGRLVSVARPVCFDRGPGG